MTILETALLISTVLFGAIALMFFIRVKRIQQENSFREEATKDQFYEIVHELRAPLTAVKDAASLLNDMRNSLNQEEQTKMLSLIKTECVRLLEQVSGFLDASKVLSNKLTIQKSPNDLGNLLKEKIIIYTAQAKAADIVLVSEVDEHLPTVMYDPKYMNQVMNNLISNSLKYTPHGGTITVKATTEDNTIVISVFDNGNGVPDEKQKELFKKFASLNHRDDKTVSSGLGLYVVKGIIEAHGGTVMIDTKEGRGYKIVITLPLTNLPASLVNAPKAS